MYQEIFFYFKGDEWEKVSDSISENERSTVKEESEEVSQMGETETKNQDEAKTKKGEKRDKRESNKKNVINFIS